jgi:hypothetical protein
MPPLPGAEVEGGDDTNLALSLRHHNGDHTPCVCFAIERRSLLALLLLIQRNQRVVLNRLLHLLALQIVPRIFFRLCGPSRTPAYIVYAM